MSTNYTKNYNLCQWEASDRVLREDFNADNAKIDAGLAGLQARLASLEGTAYTTGRPQVAAGGYEGNGNSSRLIQTGFRPKAVWVVPHTFQIVYNLSGVQHTYGGFAVDGMQMVTYTPAVTISAAGFLVYNSVSGSVSLESNKAGQRYFYIAVG